MISKINIISNKHRDSLKIKRMLIKEMKLLNLKYSPHNPDVVISIGGDGTYLKAVREFNYSNDILFLGINTGHIGFIPNVAKENVENLLSKLVNGDFKIEHKLVQNIIFKNNDCSIPCKVLNDFVLREKNLKTLKMEVSINGEEYQKFKGDGFISSTPTGSTAYNFSLGNSIIHPSIECIQIAPLCNVPNSHSYRSINSGLVLPINSEIELKVNSFNKNKLIVSLDGEYMSLNFNIDKIIIKSSRNRIKNVIVNNVDFIKKLNKTFVNY